MTTSLSLVADADAFVYAASDVSLVSDARGLFTAYIRRYADAASEFSSAELIFGEIFGNVVRHAPGPITIRVRWQRATAILEIWDKGPGYDLAPVVPDALDESRRGLFIVAALGRNLQVQRHGVHTVTSVGLPILAHTSARAAAGGTLDTAPDMALADEPNRAVTLLQAMMSVHSPAVVVHMEAVAALAERTARAMHLDEGTVERCRLAGRIHDVGLNAVDPSPIHAEASAGTPDRADTKTIAHHPRHAETIANATPALAALAPILRAHHERIDGTGYPDGLIGQEIPLESRIIAVADAFHAMTTTSSYRDLTAPAAAIDELFRQRNTQFDAGVVSAFAAMLGYRRADRSQSA